MNTLTKKYIFKCKLAGEAVEFDTEEVLNKKIRKLLMDTGVWKVDLACTDRFWREYAFTILYPIRMIDTNGDGSRTPHFMENGDHHTVCL